MRNVIDIFSEIHSRQVRGVMFHNETAQMFDFLGLRGYKRQHEYQMLEEIAEMRSTERFTINNIEMFVKDVSVEKAGVIPSNWYTAKRSSVTESDRRNWVKELTRKWCEWEAETLKLYEKNFKELCDNGYVYYADKINDLIKKVGKEFKYARREYIVVTTEDISAIMLNQDKIHQHYEEQTKSTYDIDFN